MRLSRDTYTSNTIELLCIELLKGLQENKCASCKEILDLYQLDHKKYGLDITLYDLQLLCMTCHASKHGLKKCKGTLRKAKIKEYTYK